MINQIGRLVGLVLVIGLWLVAAETANAQDTAQDEAVILGLIRAADAGEPSPLTDDAVFATGRAGLLVGREDIERYLARERIVRPEERPNETGATSVQWMVFSPAGDVAYELSTFQREWDAQGGGRSFVTGSLSRVWRKINGQWLQAAYLAMPTTTGSAVLR